MKQKIKVGIVGSRTIQDREYVFSILEFYLSRLLKEYDVVIVSGEQKLGIDSLAKEFARKKNLEYIGFPPRYDLHPPKLVPLMRNSEIVNESDYLIVIQHNKSRGTQDSINKANKKGIKVKVVEYEK